MRTTTPLHLIVGAGCGLDPFAVSGRWPARAHRRRDEGGHGSAGETGTGTSDQGTADGGAPSGDQDTGDTGGTGDGGDGKPDGKAKADTDWAAEAKKWEQRAKENFAKAQAHDKAEAEKLSVTEKAEKAKAEAEAKAAQLAAELAVERAARKHKISDDKDLELLAKLPADQVEAVAKRLAAANAAGTKPDGASSLPAGGSGDKPKPATLGGALAAHYAQ